MTSTDVARANIEAFNTGDWKRLAATFADKCVYDELATHRRLEGQEAIVEANRGWKDAFPDAKGRIERAMADNGTVTLEITWQGTQLGPLHMPTGEIAPSNRRINIKACPGIRDRRRAHSRGASLLRSDEPVAADRRHRLATRCQRNRFGSRSHCLEPARCLEIPRKPPGPEADPRLAQRRAARAPGRSSEQHLSSVTATIAAAPLRYGLGSRRQSLTQTGLDFNRRDRAHGPAPELGFALDRGRRRP